MLTSVRNNTKWNELRRAMYVIGPAPRWRTLFDNGHTSQLDREWFYHFRNGGYRDIINVHIIADDQRHRELIRSALRTINVAGKETSEGFRVYGYLSDGQVVDFV